MTTKKHVADEIVEAMVDNLGSDSLKELFHKTAGFGPCTFCGKMGHEQKDCPKVKKIKEDVKKKKKKEQKGEDHKCSGAEACDVCKKAEAEEYALKSLAAFADTLDKQGFTELANILDESIKKLAQEEEEEMPSPAFETMGEPEIDEAKAKLWGIYDALSEHFKMEEPDEQRINQLMAERDAAEAEYEEAKRRVPR